jgi:hypothetical protein
MKFARASGIALLASVLVPPIGFAGRLAGSRVLVSAIAQEKPQTPGQDRQEFGEGQRLPLFGKITVVKASSLQILDVNGDTVTVNLTGKTEFRKDRQPAKRSDFKVGDVIIVRGEENPDHTWTAQVIGARSSNWGPGGFGGPGGRGGPDGGNRGEFAQAGTLGKDFVTGEIKSIDAPKLSVLRSDNVTQTIELNEDTSLRKGRESVTMADIQVGDHLFARGAMENDVFVPKMVVVISPEQWKRMQEMSGQGGGQRRLRPDAPNAQPDAQNPPEPHN